MTDENFILLMRDQGFELRLTYLLFVWSVGGTVLRLQPVEHEAVDSGVVELCIGGAQELLEAQRTVSGQSRLFELGGGVRRVVVGSAVGGGAGLPPLVVVVKVAECGRLVAVAELVVERQRAALGPRRVPVAGVARAAAASLVLTSRILQSSVATGTLSLKPSFPLVRSLHFFGCFL